MKTVLSNCRVVSAVEGRHPDITIDRETVTPILSLGVAGLEHY